MEILGCYTYSVFCSLVWFLHSVCTYEAPSFWSVWLGIMVMDECQTEKNKNTGE